MTLPLLSHPRDVHWLTISGFYDFARSGLAEWDGETFWFECVEDRQNPLYCLFPLTAEEVAFEWEVNRRFREHVGTHTDVVYENGVYGRRSHEGVRHQGEWAKFYDWHKQNPSGNYTNRSPVAFFYYHSSPHNRRARSRRYWVNHKEPFDIRVDLGFDYEW